jgi:hypothetical protein
MNTWEQTAVSKDARQAGGSIDKTDALDNAETATVFNVRVE